MDWLEVEWKGERLQDNPVQLTKKLLRNVIKRNVSVQKIIHLPLPPLLNQVSRVFHTTIVLKCHWKLSF